MSPVDPSIFKAYDIRGLYPSPLNESLISDIANGLAKLIQNETGHAPPHLVVSRDMRLSSPSLSRSVIKTLVSLGCRVTDIGLASTPTFYFAVGHTDADGGIQISASHNPKDWNGCKLVRHHGIPISGDTGINQIKTWIINHQLLTDTGGGSLTRLDALPDLIHLQTADYSLEKLKPLSIVLDPANAMGIIDLDALMPLLPCRFTKINFDLDGTFPNHEADPLKPENLLQISRAVLDIHADLGIATDGDNDRVFFVDDQGQVVPPEIIRGILAQAVLKKSPGSPIGYDTRPGKITEDMILEAGGQPFVTKVGHSLIKEQMIAQQSPFSGESSGHFFYKTPEGSFEAPVKVILDILLWLSSQNRTFSLAVKPLKKYFHSGEINSEVADMQPVFASLKTKYADAESISELDGITITYKDYWFNVRGSNTEPKIRLNLEAKTASLMEQKRDEVLALIRQA